MSRALIGAAIAAVACSHAAAPALPPAHAIGADSAAAVAAAHSLITPAAKAALERGNTFFRLKDYAAALAQYREASALSPQHSAPLFGVYMVARAVNDTRLADSAMAQIRLRNGLMAAPGGHPHS